MPREIHPPQWSRFLGLAALLALCGSGVGQDKPGKGPAFTEPPKNDPNFALQGEFVGSISVGEGKEEPLGLQIRPIAGNEFEAVSFKGGLPGQDKHDPNPIKMVGLRSGEFVILSGGPWAIFVETDHCKLIDREGHAIGRLERIQRESPTMHARPPAGAVVLFDGTNLDQFTNAQVTEDGLLMPGADLKPMFQDFDLHVEFRIPYMPYAQGQSRGNSGLYLQSRYECQVLDSFALDPLINGLGALYQFRKPDLNMALPPLVWQTYDVHFTAPRWAADGSKIRNAHITSWVNGVKVQDDVELPSKTGAGKPEEPLLLPSRLQDHGDPVRFRNIWLIDRGLTPAVEFPIYPTKEELAKWKAEEKAKAEAEAKAKAAKAKADREAKAKADAAKPEMKKDAASQEKPNSEAEVKDKKPGDATPAEKKPDDSKPAEKKPAEAKPAVQPAEKKPAEAKPAAQPAEKKPADQPPADKEPTAEGGPEAKQEPSLV